MARKPISNLTKQLHAEIIAGILADWPDAKTTGFMRTLRDLPEGIYMRELYEYDRAWWSSVSFVPDAFMIDHDLKHVVVFEAVASHDVDRAKFAKMAEMSWALDEDYYDLVLVRCDRFGRTVYLPQLASIVHGGENPERLKHSDLVYVEDWQRYTADYCLKAAA